MGPASPPTPPGAPFGAAFPPTPSAGRNPWALVGMALFAVGFLLFALGGIGSVAMGSSFGFALIPCAFILAVAGILVAALSTAARPRVLPPPPPIQQPMVPAGSSGPVELACPNCGAAPRAVDRFGIATCDYCETRFLVR